MSSTNETLLTISADDAEPSAVVDDNIPTDDVMPPTPDEDPKKELSGNDWSSSSQEIMMISDAENKDKSATEAPESLDKTSSLSSSDHQRVSNEISSDNEEKMKDENQAEVQSQSEDLSTEVDTSRAEKDALTMNEERQEEKEIVEGKTDDAEGCVDDTFVSVELTSSPSKYNNSSYEEVGGQQEQQPLMMDAAAPVSNTAVLINPSSQEVAATDAAVMIPSSTATSKSSLNISQPPSTSTTTTRRRKILHHPIISHIATKLPWDRLSNAGSACDILFNCKYSVKQVEDEVREECRRGVTGEGVYIEDNAGNGVGREDGYVNVSLNSCSDYQYQEEGCEAQDFEEILGCCSMLDNDEDSDEEDVECVVTETNVASQKVPHLVHPMIGLDGSHAVVDNNQEGREEEREYSGNNRGNSSNNELQQQQQSEKSWKQSNPSLDMMLYRQFLNE